MFQHTGENRHTHTHIFKFQYQPFLVYCSCSRCDTLSSLSQTISPPKGMLHLTHQSLIEISNHFYILLHLHTSLKSNSTSKSSNVYSWFKSLPYSLQKSYLSLMSSLFVFSNDPSLPNDVSLMRMRIGKQQ